MREKSPKTLLDFMAPELPEPAVPIIPNRRMEIPFEPKRGERVLLLGYGGEIPIESWREFGAELLFYCDREREVVAARKRGLRAVLAQAENLDDRERFEAIVLGDSSYRVHDPQRAFVRLVRALRPEGKLLMELPLEGHRGMSERWVTEAAEEEGWSGKVERIMWPAAGKCRRILEECPLEILASRVIHRIRWIEPRQFSEWIHGILAPRAVLLDASERRKLEERMRWKLQRECDENDGVFLEEETILKVEARKKR